MKRKKVNTFILKRKKIELWIKVYTCNQDILSSEALALYSYIPAAFL